MANDRVVITGLGAVSPLGVGLRAFVEGLREGRSGVRLLTESERGRCRSTVGAACDAFDPAGVLPAVELARVSRVVPMALAAAREAVAHAGLPTGDEPSEQASGRVGLWLGTGGGGIDFTLEQTSRDRASLWSVTNATHGNLAGELSIHLGLRGPSLCVSNGCASSSDACGTALDVLRSHRPGSPDAIVVVGADAHLRPEVLGGMEMLGVISKRPCATVGDARRVSRPFDAGRDGFVLGEGAWAVVLEREEHARRREREPIGELLGYGATCDAHHRVRPEPDMRESARAIRHAIEDARLSPDDVGVVQYHGTSTKLNDELETRAMREAFGEHAERIVGSSIKSMIGHPQGACGLASLVAVVGALASDAPFVPPTINLDEPDPACDLDYCAHVSRATDARVALVNCLAFGGKNSALVVRV